MTAVALSVANNATWWSAPIALRDQDDVILALPEGTQIEMHVRQTATSQDLALRLTLANGKIIMVNRDAATVRLEVPASEMQNLSAGSYVCDIRVTQPSGRAHRAAYGTLIVQQGVTR